MEQLQELLQLWTAASVLAGFQIAALSWRVKREVQMELIRQPTWVTLADFIAGLSFSILILGVFIAPALATDNVSIDVSIKLLGLALVLFMSYPFVLAAHYNLYCKWGKEIPRRRVTKQEWVAVVICIILFISYLVYWWAS